MSTAESPLQGADPGAWRGCYVSRRKGLWATRGFTLLEVLVGAAVLSVGLLGMAAMFPTGYTNITQAGKMTMALTAGRQILEDISSLPFDNINNLNNFDTLNPGSLPPGSPSGRSRVAGVMPWRLKAAALPLLRPRRHSGVPFPRDRASP